jgi:hypothetical protein
VTSRGAVPVVVCAAALAALVVAVRAASSAPSAAGCATSELVVWLDTQAGGAAAGSTYFKLVFTNLSGHVCTLRGYPGVSAVDLRGRRVGAPAARERTVPPRLVRLSAGSAAVAVLQIADALNFPRSTCRPTTAAGIRVYPPDQTASKVVPFPFRACARTGPVYLRTRAVQKR